MIRIFLGLIFLTSVSRAVDLYTTHQTPRSMAMGGTQITLTKGTESLFVNPAAMARSEGFNFMLANATAAVSTDARRLASKFSGSTTLTLADINGLYGYNSYAELTTKAGIVMPNFGVGFYSTNHMLEVFNSPPFPTFNATFISDYGYLVAGAIPVGPTTSFGVAGRHVKRWGGQKDVLITDLVGTDEVTLMETTFQDKGVGTALDLSFITTLPGSLNPTLAFVWKDVGRTTFSHWQGTQSPPSQPDNLTFGASIQHDVPLARLTHAIEYRFITTPDEDFSKKIHLGSEASIGFLDLRIGLNQGYFTYGAGVDLWFFRADAAKFASEIGNAAGQVRNDREMYSVTFEFDFDQSFKLKDSEGKKRRLKQRR